MKTLREHNTEAMRRHRRRAEQPRNNGIECPECGAEMVDSDGFVLTSSPPQKNIHCPSCQHKAYAIT